MSDHPPLVAIETPFLTKVRSAVATAHDAKRKYGAAPDDEDEASILALDRAEGALFALEEEIPRPAIEADHHRALALIASYWVTSDDTDMGTPEARCAFRLLEGLLLNAGEIAAPMSLKLDSWTAWSQKALPR